MKDPKRRLRAGHVLVGVFFSLYGWFEDSFHKGRAVGLLTAICAVTLCVTAQYVLYMN